MRCNLCVQERGNRKRHSEVEDADTEHRQVCRCVYVVFTLHCHHRQVCRCVYVVFTLHCHLYTIIRRMLL